MSEYEYDELLQLLDHIEAKLSSSARFIAEDTSTAPQIRRISPRLFFRHVAVTGRISHASALQ